MPWRSSVLSTSTFLPARITKTSRRLLAGAAGRRAGVRAPIPTLWLAAVAAFFPLASLPAANLLVERRWPAPVAQLVACHVREAQEEQQLQASVPRLTTITDGVSLAVKQQYEENPYPRWMKASPVGKSTTIEAYLRQQFPLVDLHNVAKTNGAEILIAGCGTGRHSIETARRFTGARVLAIDLSLTSLCYAKRKTRDLGLSNIEYAQADILQLHRSAVLSTDRGRGVLVCLADPMAGWRVLLSVLRPAGSCVSVFTVSRAAGHRAARAFMPSAAMAHLRRKFSDPGRTSRALPTIRRWRR